MAAIYEMEMGFHAGEKKMHDLLKVPDRENPTSSFLTPFAANLLPRCPLIALGTLDTEGRPWTSLWRLCRQCVDALELPLIEAPLTPRSRNRGGEAGFSRAIAQSIIGLKTTIEKTHDPVARILFEGKANGEVIQVKDKGKMVGGLAIDLESRKRVKLYGRMVAGALSPTEEGIGEVQLVVKVEQSLGNCPKYLNKKHITPHLPQPKLISEDLPLSQAALDLIQGSDLFFISSTNNGMDMDTNHRGGPKGFVRVLSNSAEEGLSIVYPEYSGNRLYQTLGNLTEYPRAGLVFPDFNHGNVLYLTGTTEILVGKAASALISHTNLAIKIEIEAARFVSDGLGFRGHMGEPSPYNPPVRYLSSENRLGVQANEKALFGKLINRDILTPTTARFRFQIPELHENCRWQPGQYVALDFSDELDVGYSHMRDDDPKSLNDDFLRTFTVSSRQDVLDGHDCFEITIRKAGPATNFLFRHNMKVDLEIPINGFGGEFFITQKKGESVSFVAGGVGITPVLAQAQDLDLERFRLYWTMRSEDAGLAIDTFKRVPGLALSTKLFFTGSSEFPSDSWATLQASGAELIRRRMTEDDTTSDPAARWYLCTGASFRDSVLGWLAGKTVVYEDFNY